jgi:hypothetical protein
MIEAFVCSDPEDARYLALTVRLLEFHRIAVWPGTAELTAGTVDPARRAHAIGTADRMLLMVTGAALESSAVAAEVAAYRAGRPGAPVVPLLFDDVAPGALAEPGRPAPIRFFADLDAGYAELVRSFGRPYLPAAERRGDGDRRSTDRRRGDQRRTSTAARLRIGMWKNYAAATGFGEYDEFGFPDGPDGAEPGSGRLPAINRLATVFAAADAELSRYHLVDRVTGAEVRLDFEGVRELAHAACAELELRGPLRNIYVVEQLAELVADRFEVHQRDRRGTDRRSGADRRTDDEPA